MKRIVINFVALLVIGLGAYHLSGVQSAQAGPILPSSCELGNGSVCQCVSGSICISGDNYCGCVDITQFF